MKPQPLVNKIAAHLDFLLFPTPEVSAVRARCLNCDCVLTLNQPDPDSPDRLLGVCEQCKHWFLIDLLSDLSTGIMVRLPDTEVIRNLSRENPSDGISLMSHEPDPGPPPPPKPIKKPGRSRRSGQ